MTPETKMDAAIALVRGLGVPQFGWIWKSQKWYHKAIGWCLGKIGNPGYMSSYWTTFRYTVGRPSEAQFGMEDEWTVFCHEGVHALDAKRITFPLFALIFGLPQVLALLAVPLAVLLVLLTHSFLGLLGLLALVFLAPLPAPGRVLLELRGYKVSMACDFWYYGCPIDSQAYLAAYLEPFIGGGYYFMGTLFKSYIQKELEGYFNELKAGRGYQGDVYLTAVRDMALRFANQDQ